MSVRKVRDALVLMGAFIALIWILQVFNWADGYRLDLHFGILPHHLDRLPEIFSAPFLHFSWQHIEGNTVPLFVLGALAALARALDELTGTARAGKATPADMSGGTITITNVGVFGVDAGTPILTPGEAAILAFGQVRDMPWVHQGELAVRKVTTLSLSFDHRIVDGELGSAVLRDVGSMLEDPVRLLAWS